MELKVYNNYSDLSAAAANLIIDCIRRKPDATFCLATGDTPMLTYQLAVEAIVKQRIDTSRCFFIGLDEWLGISQENKGSCHQYLKHNFFEPIGIRPEQIHLFDSKPVDEQEEYEKMNRIIEKRGITFMLVGIGMNGHIGFNEPGADIDALAHVTQLDEITKKTGVKYFNEPVLIDRGITLGLKQVMQAGTLLMMANGKKKTTVIKKALEGEISTVLPASLVRWHPSAWVMIDVEAASELEIKF